MKRQQPIVGTWNNSGEEILSRLAKKQHREESKRGFLYAGLLCAGAVIGALLVSA